MIRSVIACICVENCRPMPGKRIRGHILTDNSVTVHSLACNLVPEHMLAHQLLDMRWGEDAVDQVRTVRCSG